MVLDGCDQLGLGLVSGEASRALEDCPTLLLDIAQFRGPATPVPLVVWVARSRPSSANLDAVRAWMQVEGVCILGCPEPIAEFAGFSIVARRDFSRTESGRFARQQGEGSATTRQPDLFVHHLVAI